MKKHFIVILVLFSSLGIASDSQEFNFDSEIEQSYSNNVIGFSVYDEKSSQEIQLPGEGLERRNLCGWCKINSAPGYSGCYFNGNRAGEACSCKVQNRTVMGNIVCDTMG